MEIRPVRPLLVALLLSVACGATEAGTSAGDRQAAPSNPGAPDRTEKTATTTAKGKPVVVMQTSLGDITIEFYPKEAPISVENFLQYVDDGFYDGTVFHRVVPNFVIQGGGMTADGKQKKTRAPIENEAKNGLKNDRGWLSMARTSDVNSATSQFFVNVVDNDFLNHGVRDYGYAVFARVTDGMDVVDKIVGAGAQGNVEIVKASRK